VKIDLFDAQQPGQGATGAALGILMAVISQKRQGRGWQLRQASLARYRSLLPELTEVTGQIIPVNRHGLVKLRLEDDGDRWQTLQLTRHKQGYPLEIWDREQLNHHLPVLQSTKLQGAIYSPWDWQISPLPLTQALLTAAVNRGVSCHFQTPVQPLTATTANTRCQAIETPQGSFPSDYVIITAGLGTTVISQGDLCVEPVIGQAFLLELPAALTLTRSPDWHPVLTAADIHLVPLANRQYWLGATVEFPADCPQGEANEHLRENLWQTAIAYYPFLAQARILKYWSGKRPRPVGESAPVIRPLAGYDNVLIASGHYRNGVLLAPATAIAVREWLEQLPLG
jgi:glycine/D-amino acid oxidase-like deaminating enzyme